MWLDRPYMYWQQSANHKSWIIISDNHFLYFYRLSYSSRHCISFGWFRQCEQCWFYHNERFCEKPGQFLQRKRHKGMRRMMMMTVSIIVVIIIESRVGGRWSWKNFSIFSSFNTALPVIFISQNAWTYLYMDIFPLFLQFAIVQFSDKFQLHFSFSDFDKNNINNIDQLGGWTKTASAIRYVV